MRMTKRRPAGLGEILTEEFLRTLGMTQTELAEATGLPRKHVNELLPRPARGDGRHGAHSGAGFRQLGGIPA